MTRLLAEIREPGYTATAICSFATSTRAAHDQRAAPPPRRLVSWLMTRPAELPDHDRGHLEDLLASCPHLTVLAENVRADGLGGLLHEYVQVARRSHDVTALSAATPREPSANSRRHLARGRFFERDLRLLVKKS